MTRPDEELIELEVLLALVGNDRELIDWLCEAGFVAPCEGRIARREAEVARVAHTLARELEVNRQGVEIILRMRRELIDTRRQMLELVELVRRTRRA